MKTNYIITSSENGLVPSALDEVWITRNHRPRVFPLHVFRWLVRWGPERVLNKNRFAVLSREKGAD